MFGRGNDPDVEGAMNLHATAAGKGDTRAMIRLGLAHASGAQGPFVKAQAFKWMRKAADNGDAEGMFLTAMIYEDGAEGVPASMPDMVTWLTKAAQNGHAFAMFILGHIYLDGEDGIIPKDIVKTERYWTMAAESGLVEAMDMLAEFYEGEDTAASARWAAASRAAPGREPWREDPRCLSVWECYIPQIMESAAPPLSPEDSARLPFEMQPCDRFAAVNNDPDLPDQTWVVPYGEVDGSRAIEACLADIKRFPEARRFHTQLATAYHRVERYHEAFVEASTAAEMGSTQAMGMVAIMYKNGRGVEKSSTNALYWFEKGASLGNMTAMHFAGYMQLNGDGVPFNTKAAVKWFQTAADVGTGFGSADAMAQLGLLYDNGQGVDYDPDKSAANLMSGLALGSTKAQEVLLKNPKQLSPHTLTEVQRLLQQDGLYHGALDGKFGPQTFQALRSMIKK
jgi:TPR repeat protein